MPERRRVAFVQTHPVQYLSPWFRWIAAHELSIDLTVLYAAEPTPAAQAVGFGGTFTWDLPLREGYRNRVLSAAPFDGTLDAARFSDVDAPNLEAALAEIDPDAVVVPGWHAAYYRRALDICARRDWPAIYRGDSTMASGRRHIPRFVRALATRRRVKQFAAYLAVGTRAREHLLAHGAVEPLVFASPHAVDLDLFRRAVDTRRSIERQQEIRARFNLDSTRPVVLFAGKLQAHKRPLDLIRAAAGLGPAAQLLVAGAGPLERACRAEAERQHVAAAFAGFLQPREITDAHAVADVLALPSEGETWGLVVNEALACGVPCVVSDAVGCHPDLITDDTGGTFPVGDVAALAGRLQQVLSRIGGGHRYEDACLMRARTHSFEAATQGLVRAVDRLGRRAARVAGTAAQHRLVACCGSMVVPGGAERMTFEVLRRARRRGVGVHCIVNTWSSTPIVDMAEQIGASWSTGFYWFRLERRIWRPTVAARQAWDVLRTSAGLLRDCWQQGATAVLLPDFTVVLRNLPALLLLRLAGIRIVHRLGNAPDVAPGYARLWRWVVAPASDALVCNSPFTARELKALGVPSRKITVAQNVLPDNRRPLAPSAAVPGRILYVGQIIPAKGVHLLLDAVALLLEGGHDVTLDVVGDIDGWEPPGWAGYHARLRARAAVRPLTGRVRFLGWRDDVPSLMREAWIHAAPSLPEIREGFGIVVLEAKAAGVPSVVGPSGALPDLVTQGVDGWVAAASSAEAFAEGIASFLNPDARAAASMAALSSLARFSPEAFDLAWAAAFDWIDPLPCPEESRPCA